MLIIKFVTDITRIGRRIILAKNYGAVLYKLKEHGRINNVFAGMAVLFLFVFLTVGYFYTQFTIGKWIEQKLFWKPSELILCTTIFFDLLSQALILFLKAFTFIEIRDMGFISSLRIYSWETIDYYTWEEIDSPSWDRENRYYILNLVLKNKRQSEEKLRIRVCNKERFNEVLKTKIK